MSRRTSTLRSPLGPKLRAKLEAAALGVPPPMTRGQAELVALRQAQDRALASMERTLGKLETGLERLDMALAEAESR